MNETIQKHRTSNTKTKNKQYKNAVHTSTHINKTPTQLLKHPHIHTLICYKTS